MSGTRVGYLDIAKAIAIAFIIIGHTGLVFNADVIAGGMPSWLERFAFTLQLPVFFIVSGYFFKINKPLSRELIARDIKNLLLPYVVTCALIIFFCSLQALISPTAGVLQEFTRWFGASLYGAGAVSPVALIETERIGGIWFLLALFWAHLIITLTYRLPDWSRLLILIGLLILSIWSAQYIWLPLSIQSGMGCALYVFIGALIKKHDLFAQGKIPTPWWILILILWAITICYGGEMSMAMSVYPLGIFDLLGGIAACFCIVRGSAFLESHTPHGCRWLQVVGRNTLAIFTLHILEDNVIPWGEIGIMLSDAFGGFPFTWAILQLLRFGVDAILAAIAYVLPGIRWVYFPQLRTSASPKERLS